MSFACDTTMEDVKALLFVTLGNHGADFRAASFKNSSFDLCEEDALTTHRLSNRWFAVC